VQSTSHKLALFSWLEQEIASPLLRQLSRIMAGCVKNQLVQDADPQTPEQNKKKAMIIPRTIAQAHLPGHA
jgi:hypothetical protein